MSISKTQLTQEHLKAIGLIVTEWSWVEHSIELIIWELAQIDPDKGRSITTHIQSETRLHILSSLTDSLIHDHNIKKQISQLADKVRKLRGERNNITHALWLKMRPQGLISKLMKLPQKGRFVPSTVKITAKGKVEFTTKPFTAAEIRDVAQRMSDLLDEIVDLQSKIREYRAQR